MRSKRRCSTCSSEGTAPPRNAPTRPDRRRGYRASIAAISVADASVTGHVPPHRREIGASDLGLVHQVAVKHDDEAVGQLEQLLAGLAEQEDRGAAVAGPPDLSAERG